MKTFQLFRKGDAGGDAVKTFQLFRKEDESGISGTGVVAEGVQFSNGKCAMAWLTEVRSVAVYDSIDDLVAIHGHNGKTEVRFISPMQELNFRLEPMEMDKIWRGVKEALEIAEARIKQAQP